VDGGQKTENREQRTEDGRQWKFQIQENLEFVGNALELLIFVSGKDPIEIDQKRSLKLKT